jgi:hypothetical protein
MKRPIWLVAALLAALLTPGARAGERPSFWERYSAWHATHVVVVDQDGKVLESWKGNLTAGQKIVLKPLGIPQTPKVAARHAAGPNDLKAVTGQRMILFLRRGAKGWGPASGFGGMEVSVVWVEGGRAYAFVQEQNPGPSELVPLRHNEGDLKDTVQRAVRVQSRLERAAGEPDRAKRARALVPFLDEPTFGSRDAACDALAGCGRDALVVLRPLLADDRRLSQHGDFLTVMTRAAGKEARPDLEKMLEQELAYWKKVGPGLDQWWGREPMTRHYSRLITVLREMKRIGYADKRKLVRQLRDYWESLPQLDYIGKGTGPDGKPVGRSQVVEEAEAVIGK